MSDLHNDAPCFPQDQAPGSAISWTDETQRHEGYIKMVFADGRLGGGTYSAAGFSVDGAEGLAQLDELGNPGENRPAAAIIGWRLACAHVPAHVRDDNLGRYFGPPETWLSPVAWTRVYTANEQDLDRRRIYAPLDEEGSVFVEEREDELYDLLRAEWREHIAPEDHARSIRTAATAIIDTQQQLDLEVAGARTAGLSWAEIGRAAGITRQAARERWGVDTTGRS